MSSSQHLLSLLFQLITTLLHIPILLYQYLIDSYALLTTVSRRSPDNIDEGSPEPSKLGLHTSPLFRRASSVPITKEIIEAIDIVDICHAHGYKVHEHVVQTKDGYLLAIHRVLKHSRDIRLKRPVVYFHHGLLTNSELFVLGETPSKCLPYLLLEKGYDIWIGNNRGNKYSRKHISLSSASVEFWDYSLDEFALYDIPNTIDYILSTTGNQSLTYIGFSQGSAQAFGALSLSPSLNEKINLFVGLSPAMIPKGLKHPIARLFQDAAPSLLFSIFGRRAILPSVVFWQKILGSHYYELVVDKCLVLLFGWDGENVSDNQKTIGYPHLFSPSSVKSVVHWFQIINSKRFQMYDEGQVSRLTTLTSTDTKVHRVAPFPVQTISTPVLLVYGKSDILIDIDPTLEQLASSKNVSVLGIDTYEHMDVLWAKDAETKVFEPVIQKVDEYNKCNVMKQVKKIDNQMVNMKEANCLNLKNDENIPLLKSSEGSMFI